MSIDSFVHFSLTEDMTKYICNGFDTDIKDIKLYSYRKQKNRLYGLIVKCNGTNIQKTDNIVKDEFGLDDRIIQRFDDNDYILLYDGLEHDQIVYWYGFIKQKLEGN